MKTLLQCLTTSSITDNAFNVVEYHSFYLFLYLIFWYFTIMGLSISLFFSFFSFWLAFNRSFPFLSLFSSGKEECRKPIILVIHSFICKLGVLLPVLGPPSHSHLMVSCWTRAWSLWDSADCVFLYFAAVPSCSVWAVEFLVYGIPQVFQKWFEIPTDGCPYHPYFFGLILTLPVTGSLPSWIRELSLHVMKSI